MNDAKITLPQSRLFLEIVVTSCFTRTIKNFKYYYLKNKLFKKKQANYSWNLTKSNIYLK